MVIFHCYVLVHQRVSHFHVCFFPYSCLFVYGCVDGKTHFWTLNIIDSDLTFNLLLFEDLKKQTKRPKAGFEDLGLFVVILVS